MDWTYGYERRIMTAMRELSDEFKLSVRTIAEVFQGLTMLVARLATDRAIRFRERGREKRPTRAAIVSALILWLDAQPHAEQRRVISEGMARLNRLLEGEETAIQDDPPAPPPIVAEPEPKPKNKRPRTNKNPRRR